MMISKARITAISGLMALTSCFAGLSSAATITENQSGAIVSGTSLVDNPHLAGEVIDEMRSTFNMRYNQTEHTTGTIVSQVVRSSVDGTIDFYWQIFNDPTSHGIIDTLQVFKFDRFPYNADWRSDSDGDVGPRQVVALPGGGDGRVMWLIGEIYGGTDLRPGQRSYAMFFDTTETTYRRDGYMYVTGDWSTLTMPTFAPPIPEPSSYAMLLAGGAILVSVFVRRRRSVAHPSPGRINTA